MPRTRVRQNRSLYLTEAEYERVMAAAAQEGLSFQDFVRGLLGKYTGVDAPPLSARVFSLEDRVAELEALLGATPDTPPELDLERREAPMPSRRARRPKESAPPTPEP